MIQNELEKKIIKELNNQSDYFNNHKDYQEDIRNSKFSSIRVINKTEIWSTWSTNILKDMNNNFDVLKSFRKKNYFITDVPGDMNGLKDILQFFLLLPKRLENIIQICMLEDFYDFLKSKDLLELLKTNSSPITGNQNCTQKIMLNLLIDG